MARSPPAPSPPAPSPPAPSPAVERAKARVGHVLREKWRLDKLLGVGGSAAVYSSTHINNGKRAAVKVLHPELCTQREVVTRFLKEGYFSNKIDHPGSVSVIDDDRSEDGSVYLVMELLEGHSLEKFARGKEKLAVPEVIRVVDQVLDLLAVAHKAGVLHRDIKPANIYMTKTGQVKVLDFGIARLAEQQGESITQTGTGIGTPSYMPPEQARGRWNLVDGRSDVFAVGATMYALLIGSRPRKAETANEELLLAMTEPLPKIETQVPDLESSIAEVVNRAVAFDMDARWPSARTMQQALRMIGQIADEDTDTSKGAASTSKDAHPASKPIPAPPRSQPSRAVPDGPRYRVPELTRSGPVAAVKEPLPEAEPPFPAEAPPPEIRSRLPSIDVDVDLGHVEMTPATPPPLQVEPSQILARRPFTTQTAMLAIAFEPHVGYILLGPHAPKGEPARYRAWLMGHASPLWETFHDQPWVNQVKDVRAFGGMLFVGLRQTLLCVDLVTGQTRWSMQLPDKIEVRPGGEDHGPVVLDFLAQGAIVLQCGISLVAVDPMSGRELWRRAFPGKLDVLAIEGGQSFAVRYNNGKRGALEILQPSSPNAVASFGTQWFTDEASVIDAHPLGTRIAARVDNWGLMLAKGIVVVDVLGRRQLSFDREKDVDITFPPQPAHNGVYYITMGVLHGPGGRRAAPSIAGHRYLAFRLVGPVVMVVLEEHGTGRIRLVSLDAATLQLKQDFGLLFPPGRFSFHLPQSVARYCLTSGEVVVFPAWTNGRVELRCAHVATGQVFWARPRQEPSPIDDSYMLGGQIVLRATDSIEILEPKLGMLAARYGS